jgi:hypothetical protein
MSGPKSVVIATPDPCTSLLAAAAIQAAAAVAEGYQRAAELRTARLKQTEANRRLQQASRQEAETALRERLDELESRFSALQALAESLDLGPALAAIRPSPPGLDEPELRQAYAESLESSLSRAESILRTEAARQQKDLLEPEAIRLPDAPSGPATLARRLLARIAHLGPPPADLLALAAELDGSPPGERATLLATELRGRVQTLAEAAQRQALQEAQALILGHALHNLGYEVEEIGHTLFVEGGVVHFRRPGWGDYMVRLRLATGGGAANFNVVRAVDAGNPERSVLDHIAEDRWCAEFPALLKALEASGLRLTVTRHLAPGELPVQFVERSKLPDFGDETESLPETRLLSRQLPS